MTPSSSAVVVLAAGLGTRMKSRLPKVMHRLAGKPLLAHVLDTVARLAPVRVVTVLGPGMESAARLAEPNPVVVQEDRLGTGHALQCAAGALGDLFPEPGAGHLLVVYGDTPFLTAGTLSRMIEALEGASAPGLVALGFRPDDPGHYGRLVVSPEGDLQRIVEFADSNTEERTINICNAGLLAGDGHALLQLASRLDNANAKGEYYLTDVFALARQSGVPTRFAEAPESEVMGINSRAELAMAEAVLQERLRAGAMEEGATLLDPGSVWLSMETELGHDVTVEPNVVFAGSVVVEEGATIRSFSHLDGVHVGRGAVVGPFARLRPGTTIGPDAQVGNFVEIKNTALAAGAKANHLAYLGDAEVGERANIGAGTITCNYDGFAKHRTTIGKGAFIGSNTALVAPVNVGSGALVAAGSTITSDVAAGALSIARACQHDVDGGAERFRGKRTARSEGAE